jgi:hypothetical protein
MQVHKLPRTILTLQKRGAALRTLLSKSANEHKLLKAAERVRAGRIQVLRSTIGDMPTPIRTPLQNKRIARLNSEIESLVATTPATILEEFRRKSRPKS